MKIKMFALIALYFFKTQFVFAAVDPEEIYENKTLVLAPGALDARAYGFAVAAGSNPCDGEPNEMFVGFMFDVGDSYRLGKRLEKDESKAFQWYQKAAFCLKKSYAQQIDKAIYRYFNGAEGVEKDASKAAKLLLIMARNNNSIAQAKIGTMYLDGVGVQHNLDKSMIWLESSLQNSAGESADVKTWVKQHSHLQLGRIYSYSKAKHDDKKAFYHVDQSAKNGSVLGTFIAGLFYYEGTGVKQDKAKGLQMIKQAADAGLEGAKKYIKENNL